MKCKLVEEGFKRGSCLVSYKDKQGLACKLTLRYEGKTPYRLISSAHLSRPEHYFSIYQSGCNLSCKKCHSWYFTQHARGRWCSPSDIAKLAESYANAYEKVMYKEPKERATHFHASDICKGCGTCVKLEYFLLRNGKLVDGYFLVPTGRRSRYCPKKVKPEQIVLSPQGFGPARNIIAFTGGDLACQPEFYARAAEKIKELDKNLWILLETNGYGLTPKNLDFFEKAGIDSFWLDIKAYDENLHKALTGVSNDWILKLPEEILSRDFTLEVLSLYIPGWVETDQIEKIACLLASIDEAIPFTILAFFPEYKLREVPSPSLEQMLSAYNSAKQAGLKNVKLGNIGQFAKANDLETLRRHAPDSF
jgi:pyruvate-formate lyase-activating enzyme